MAANTPNQNQQVSSPPCPPRHILLRSILLTISFYILFIGLLFAWYSKNHPHYTFLEIFESSLPISLGISIGIFAIWLVYPSSYGPQYFDEFFPKASWVFLWYLFLGPLVVVIFSGWSLFNVHNLPFSPDSPLTTNFYYTENIAFLTYLVFFSILGLNVKKQLTNLSAPPSHA